MNDLLRAIIADPDDDTLRLIYADWLEEHGQVERAEFIRIQIERHRDWPLDHDSAVREQELLTQHRSAWKAELPAIPGVEWEGFTRGFAACAKIEDAATFEQHGATILEQTPVRGMHFVPPPGDWIEPVQPFPDVDVFPDDDGLILSDFDISPERVPTCIAHLTRLLTCPAIQSMRALRVGEIARDQLRAEGARLLAVSPYLSSLKSLDVSRQDIGDDGIIALAQSAYLRQLAELDLSGDHHGLSGPHEFDVPGLAALGRLGNALGLRRLRLAGVNLSDSRVHALVSGSSLCGLEALDLSENSIHGEGADAIAHCRALANLRELRLGDNPLGLMGVDGLSRSRILTRLQFLDLSAAEIGPDAARWLARSPILAAVRFLDVKHNPLGDAGVAELAQARNADNLAFLDLSQLPIYSSDGPLTAAGLRALADSTRLPALVGLRLSGNDILRNGMEMLVRRPNLRHLEMANVDIGDRALSVLANSPLRESLVVLDLSRNKITSEGSHHFYNPEYWPQLRRLDLSGNLFDATTRESLRHLWGHRIDIDEIKW